ncbi:hypothetical protein HYV50_04960 [Candidatus Pacearchaeota archaeon]|nr:hypothetical protein [Candidatus Pacearchaeota archaeon]
MIIVQKRGLSSIVAVVLIVFLTISSIALLWSFLGVQIFSFSESIQEQFRRVTTPPLSSPEPYEESTSTENNTSPINTSCQLIGAQWDRKIAPEGSVVEMAVLSNESCIGRNINFEIYEDDTINDDKILNTSIQALILSDKLAIASWRTQRPFDYGNPEFYFCGALSDNPNIEICSELLKVISGNICSYELKVQNSVTVDGKRITLLNVDSELTILLDINGTNGTILIGRASTINGVLIANINATYSSNNSEKSAYIEVIGEECGAFCGDKIIQENQETCDGNLEICNNNTGYKRCLNDCSGFEQECVPFQLCGDGTRDIGEECDDGNSINGDGCNSNCEVEFCGDLICNNMETCRSCLQDCGRCNQPLPGPFPGPRCGDGKCDPDELRSCIQDCIN